MFFVPVFPNFKLLKKERCPEVWLKYAHILNLTFNAFGLYYTTQTNRRYYKNYFFLLWVCKTNKIDFFHTSRNFLCNTVHEKVKAKILHKDSNCSFVNSPSLKYKTSNLGVKSKALKCFLKNLYLTLKFYLL